MQEALWFYDVERVVRTLEHDVRKNSTISNQLLIIRLDTGMINMKKDRIVLAITVVVLVAFASYLRFYNALGHQLREDSELKITLHLTPTQIASGDLLTVSAFVWDCVPHSGACSRPIEGAQVTATIGDLEILFLLSDQGKGYYQVTIQTPTLQKGEYSVVVTAQKLGYGSCQATQMLTVK